MFFNNRFDGDELSDATKRLVTAFIAAFAVFGMVVIWAIFVLRNEITDLQNENAELRVQVEETYDLVGEMIKFEGILMRDLNNLELEVDSLKKY